MNQQAERRVGTIIGGKWRVDALLGSGSMAAVYAATHRNGARAGLKILHPTLCSDPAVCERFLGEGYLANSVKHPGIIRVLDDGVTDDGCVFLVMDLLEGETLEALRQRRGGRIPIVETLDLSDKLMDVLGAVHTAGIIHRDLKPQNVFVCTDNTLKLLDFGVARVFDRTSQSKLSMFGLVLGTPSFMSPEQALGSRDKVDHRSDIWSLGATMFTSFTGETVHLGANVQAKLLAAATVKARSLQMVMPDLPSPVSAVVDMALRFKKEDRWQSVDAMRRALRDARMQAGLGKPRTVPPPAYDMSLDDTTHVDKGAPAFDASTTLRDAPSAQGPDGTFIGIGSGANMRSMVGNDGSVPPAGPAGPAAGEAIPRPPRPAMRSAPPEHGPPRAPMPSSPPLGTPGNAMSPPLMRMPDPLRGSRPDGQEGSIPAYGGTVKVGADDSVGIAAASFGVRRKGIVAVWLAAVFLSVAALGGLAFLASQRTSAKPDGAGTAGSGTPPPPATPTTPVTTPVTLTVTPTPTGATTVTAPTSTSTTTLLPLIAAPTATTVTADAASPVRTAAAVVPPRPPVFGPTGVRTPPRPPRPAPGTDSPAPTAEPTRTPPGLASDPFGTPE